MYLVATCTAVGVGATEKGTETTTTASGSRNVGSVVGARSTGSTGATSSEHDVDKVEVVVCKSSCEVVDASSSPTEAAYMHLRNNDVGFWGRVSACKVEQGGALYIGHDAVPTSR